MTLFAQVKVFRKGVRELTHLVPPAAAGKEPLGEMAWVVAEGKNDQVVVAGFAADGAPFTASGKLAELTTKPAPLPTPTFLPLAGPYPEAQTVTVALQPPKLPAVLPADAVIYYTLDGSDPTSVSPVYSVPLAIDASLTLKALAMAADYPSSEIAKGVYTIGAVKTEIQTQPQASPRATVEPSRATPEKAVVETPKMPEPPPPVNVQAPLPGASNA